VPPVNNAKNAPVNTNVPTNSAINALGRGKLLTLLPALLPTDTLGAATTFTFGCWTAFTTARFLVLAAALLATVDLAFFVAILPPKIIN
jgi:hypothetical protein